MQQGHHFLLQLLSASLRSGQFFLGSLKVFLHGGYLLLSLRTLQQGLDLEEQFHPGPVLDVHESTDIVLDAEDGFSVGRKEASEEECGKLRSLNKNNDWIKL